MDQSKCGTHCSLQRSYVSLVNGSISRSSCCMHTGRTAWRDSAAPPFDSPVSNRSSTMVVSTELMLHAMRASDSWAGNLVAAAEKRMGRGRTLANSSSGSLTSFTHLYTCIRHSRDRERERKKPKYTQGDFSNKFVLCTDLLSCSISCWYTQPGRNGIRW